MLFLPHVWFSVLLESELLLIKYFFAELVGWKANLLNALSYMIGMLGLLYIYYRGSQLT